MYAIKAMTKNGQACVKEQYKGYEISIAFDDSCGGAMECSRGDIEIFNSADGMCVTREFFTEEGVVIANLENLVYIKSRIDVITKYK